MINLEHLTINYGDNTVVKDLNFSLGHDEILMLVGPTGCGKSTILKAIAGLVPIADGKITNSHWVADAKHQVPPEKRNLGMVFQDFALFPHLSVLENVSFRLKTTKKAEHWLAVLGLSEFAQVKPSQLSGGQKQRVALARTLAHEPALVLLDEPLSSLDAALKDELRWQIRDALKAAGVPAIWVTHDQEEALSIGDQVGVLRAGNLEQLADPQTCYNTPANEFVAGFLGDANFLDGQLDSNNNCVNTVLGSAAIHPNQHSTNQVKVLLRPEDIDLQANEQGNGKVIWSRFEGKSSLVLVELSDGEQIRVRQSNKVTLHTNQTVQLTINTQAPLSVFPATDK